MKKKMIIYLAILMTIIVTITGIVLVVDNSKQKSLLNQYFEEEVVIDNEISLKAKEIHDYMRENNYGYCTYDYRCDHEGECGLASTFEASKKGVHNTCCATYVSWVLQETGYITKKQHVDNNFNAANNLSKYLEQNGWKVLGKDEKMMPGDILVYNHHVAIYGGRGAQYDAGNRELLTVNAPCRLTGNYSAANAKKVLRAPEKIPNQI